MEPTNLEPAAAPIAAAPIAAVPTAAPAAAPAAAPIAAAAPAAAPGAAPAAGHPRRERLRRRLGLAAVIACLPYLGLKLLWVCGVDVGVVDRSRLGVGAWAVANLLTFLMDATAALIARQLARPGGPRMRGPFLALPMWVASGLLAPIMIAVPLQTLAGLFRGQGLLGKPDGFLEPWVFGLVYGGFLVEGVALLGAFALYAHDRLGPVLDAPVRAFARRVPGGVRTAVAVAAGLLAVTAAVRIAWASGAEFGLSAVQVAGANRSSLRLVEAVQGVLALAAAGGLAVLARGRAGTRVRVPLVAAWVGSATAFGWGGFIGGLGAFPTGRLPTAIATAVCLAEAAAGFLVVGAGLAALGGRASAPADGLDGLDGLDGE
ncbi:hypothetical protein ACIQBJ_13925 [Kitasatospora sp. NPDC088391]|uniref:hypothetical protein n=1 Tax=Kitasatospora sp. NPDC088391 TaxID=3364074 RepID=UPI00382D6968